MQLSGVLTWKTASSWAGLPPPATNPLTQEDSLREAQVMGVRLDSLTGEVGVLFELRMALEYWETADTGVLVAEGVRRLAWTGPQREPGRTAWSAGGSRVEVHDGLLWLSLGMWPAPGATLEVVAERAVFVGGRVPGIGDTPPDYTGDEVTIVARLASWDSQFRPTTVATFGQW